MKKDDTPLRKIDIVKNTFIVAKTKFLNLGKPHDEKELLYKEVIKQEKRDAKEAKTADTKKSSSKKTSTKTKKPATKAKSTSNKSTAKSPAKKTTDTKEKATTSKTKTATKAKKTTTKAKKEGSKTATKAKSTGTKKTTASKTKTPAKGSKRDAKIALYIKDIKKHYGEVDENFVAIIVKNLGPSIYRKDAELVSCSDPKELDTVRKNFLIKKLKIDASKAVLDAAIQDVCEELKGVRSKYRATFYYALAKKFKKESMLD
ncbi:MAG: hypothetical protein DSZ09_04295 [Sulfurovum sp.]|nr:MAG: hypothetical protein DSZ09_04295 [Sulfurovum sp.]